MNKRADTKLSKAADKSASARLEKAPEAESIIIKAEGELEQVSLQISEIHYNSLKERDLYLEEREKIDARTEHELAALQEARKKVVRDRDEKIATVYKKGDKKFDKLAKKEEKIANRICGLGFRDWRGMLGMSCWKLRVEGLVVSRW